MTQSQTQAHPKANPLPSQDNKPGHPNTPDTSVPPQTEAQKAAKIAADKAATEKDLKNFEEKS